MKHPFHRHYGRYFFFPEYRQACEQLRDNLDRLLDAETPYVHRTGFSDPIAEDKKDIYDWKINPNIDLLFDCSPILAETLKFFDAPVGYWFINRLNSKEMNMLTPEYQVLRPHVDFTSAAFQQKGYDFTITGINPCKISLNLPITKMQGLRLETFLPKYDAPLVPERVAAVQAEESLQATKIPSKLVHKLRSLDANDPILLNSWQPHRLVVDEKYWDTAEEECFRLCIRFFPKHLKDVQDWDQFFSDPWDLFATPFDISWKYWEAKCTR